MLRRFLGWFRSKPRERTADDIARDGDEAIRVALDVERRHHIERLVVGRWYVGLGATPKKLLNKHYGEYIDLDGRSGTVTLLALHEITAQDLDRYELWRRQVIRGPRGQSLMDGSIVDVPPWGPEVAAALDCVRRENQLPRTYLTAGLS